MERMVRGIICGCLFLANSVIGFLFVFAGILGISGQLADVGARENLVFGLMGIAVAGVAFLNAIVLFALCNALLLGQRWRGSRIVRGLSYLGNAGCLLAGICMCWNQDVRQILFGFPVESVLLWTFGVANAALIVTSHWAACRIAHEDEKRDIMHRNGKYS